LSDIAGVTCIVVGLATVVFALPLARSRVSLHFSPTDMEQREGLRRRRIVGTLIAATVVNTVVGAALLYSGARLLLS